MILRKLKAKIARMALKAIAFACGGGSGGGSYGCG